MGATRCTRAGFINQLRQNIDARPPRNAPPSPRQVCSGAGSGNPETTTGGNALKFYASVRLDIRKTGQIKEGEVAVGTRARVKVVKNKVAPPFREAEFELRFGEGINVFGELVDLGATYGLLEKSGAWFSLDGERIGQGREKACDWLRAHPEVAEALRTRLLATTATGREAAPAVAEAAVAEAA